MASRDSPRQLLRTRVPVPEGISLSARLSASGIISVIAGGSCIPPLGKSPVAFASMQKKPVTTNKGNANRAIDMAKDFKIFVFELIIELTPPKPHKKLIRKAIYL